MKIKSIQTSKTARYILSTEPSKEIKHIWIVCHGYGQSAVGFLNWFKPIFCEDTLIVAPEGLSKFYWEGFNGKVVSSWMTKENREEEIIDYVNFIETIVNELKPKLNGDVKFNALGFSQGTATIARWANHTSIKLSSIHMWSGQFPDDLLNCWNKKQLPSLNFYVGNNDPSVDDSIVDEQKIKLKNMGINYKTKVFTGKHKVEKLPLIEINKLLKYNPNKE